MANKKQTEQKPKSFLDKPIKELFSFNVDKEIQDTANRTRGISAKIINGQVVFETYNRNYRKWKKASTYLILIFCILGLTVFIAPSIFGWIMLGAVVCALAFVYSKVNR